VLGSRYGMAPTGSFGGVKASRIGREGLEA
jgi:hypothetical protein